MDAVNLRSNVVMIYLFWQVKNHDMALSLQLTFPPILREVEQGGEIMAGILKSSVVLWQKRKEATNKFVASL